MNANKVRDCIRIIRIYTGFVISKQFGKVIPKSLGKVILAGSPIKQYYDCVSYNEKLNEQKIAKLTKEVVNLKKR